MNDNQTFSEIGIEESLITRIAEKGIVKPTAVQFNAIPHILQGKSLLFQSETGTGKTLAYLLPLIQNISKLENPKKEVKLVIIAPTYELASQIKTQVKLVTDIKSALFIGGAPIKRQIETLKEKPSIIIGGPARILELFHLKKLKLDSVSCLVLDEVDRLLTPELRDETQELMAAHRKDIQLVALSATISAATEKVLSTVKMRADGSTQSHIETLFLPPEDILRKRISHFAVFAEQREKIDTLRKILLAEKPQKALVFTSRVDQVANIVAKLKYKNIDCTGLHAKTDKVERKAAIDRFRAGKCPVLVTSDLASRGLDIPDITHVIQMDLPSNDDFFIHRAGRTARAGKTGISIVVGDAYEMRKFATLEKKLGLKVYPKMLYKGQLVAPESVTDFSED